jgi:ferredoxin-NADP reductase/MOSC domain-containing protein YiiM
MDKTLLISDERRTMVDSRNAVSTDTQNVVGRLVSVNVGMPKGVLWHGKTVLTGIWKTPVDGRRRLTRMNIDGDGQGDTAGHGGEMRAVLVYQTGSYAYWGRRLGRADLAPGHFGENFTIEGLPDDEVCIGDRYLIGTALFEVSQPRVTCYRVGIRMNNPHMAALLTASGRPGFYLRVLEEGEVGAGDLVHLIVRGPEQMTVSFVNALLYSPPHPRAALEQALRIPALSPGWRQSFQDLANAAAEPDGIRGNPALAPRSAAIASPGFRKLRVARILSTSIDVRSFELEPIDAAPLTIARPGQYVVVRLRPAAGAAPFLRSYSLSGPPNIHGYRISVKLELRGVAGAYLSNEVHVGDLIEVSQPRGTFTLEPGDGPVTLLSAGIGITPVLAMLHALAAERSVREIYWLHVARDGRRLAFRPEVRELAASLPRCHAHVWHSRPGTSDREGIDFDSSGRPTIEEFKALGVSQQADFYVCGPESFIANMRSGLESWGVVPGRLHSEAFGGGPSLTPGIVGGSWRPPHQPEGEVGSGPLVSFARSGVAVRFREADQNLLELAEACDIPVRWSCRAGVCHNCEVGLISGDVRYDPTPLDPPAEGNVLLCCARPTVDVVICG